MPKIFYVYQKQVQKITNTYIMKIKYVEGRIFWEPKMRSS